MDLGTFLETYWWIPFGTYFLLVRMWARDLITRGLFVLLGGLFAITHPTLNQQETILCAGVSVIYAIWDIILIAVTSSINIPSSSSSNRE